MRPTNWPTRRSRSTGCRRSSGKRSRIMMNWSRRMLCGSPGPRPSPVISPVTRRGTPKPLRPGRPRRRPRGRRRRPLRCAFPGQEKGQGDRQAKEPRGPHLGKAWGGMVVLDLQTQVAHLAQTRTAVMQRKCSGPVERQSGQQGRPDHGREEKGPRGGEQAAAMVLFLRSLRRVGPEAADATVQRRP